jgi:hypothetical protein
MSTDQSPALNGQLNNDQHLKEDLAAMGVFDTNMPLYCLYRQRQFAEMGYSGFEGRHYSLFESLLTDLDSAIRLQSLLTGLAFKYIMKGEISHLHIPDDPFIESERRHIFFGTAIGLPTFFIKKDSPNRFMQKILKKIQKTRHSRRYTDYIRVHISEYRKALIDIIRQDAADLIEMLNMHSTIEDLNIRLSDSENCSAHAKLSNGILKKAGVSNPMSLSALEFNSTAEKYYREDLKQHQINEGFQMLQKDLSKIDAWDSWRSGFYNRTLLKLLNGRDAVDYLKSWKKEVYDGDATIEVLRTLIHLMLLTIHQNMQEARDVTSHLN